MATLLELSDFAASSDYQTLNKKIVTAIAKKAVAIGNLTTPTAAQIDWCKAALAAPADQARTVINYVLAANAGFTIAQIIAATDTAVETQVNAAIDKILSL